MEWRTIDVVEGQYYIVSSKNWSGIAMIAFNKILIHDFKVCTDRLTSARRET